MGFVKASRFGENVVLFSSYASEDFVEIHSGVETVEPLLQVVSFCWPSYSDASWRGGVCECFLRLVFRC